MQDKDFSACYGKRCFNNPAWLGRAQLTVFDRHHCYIAEEDHAKKTYCGHQWMNRPYMGQFVFNTLNRN